MPHATPLVVAGLALALVGCGREPEVAAASPKAELRNAGYAVSPMVTGVTVQADGLRLQGRAASGARVRLATPAGEAIFAEADGAGTWRLSLPAAAEPQVFGLSAAAAGRTVQAQGYLLVAPAGQVAILRAGSGALRLDDRDGPGITAFDFDREGGAAVSGHAPPGAALSVRVDGAQAADGRADEAGLFNIALAQPVRSGSRTVEVQGEGFSRRAAVTVTPAPPLTDGPFRATPAGGGLRVDWMTPGGGVQSTLLVN